MLYSGKKIRALRDKKKKILTLVLSEKKILNETKKPYPPFQVKWSVPKHKFQMLTFSCSIFLQYMHLIKLIY